MHCLLLPHQHTAVGAAVCSPASCRARQVVRMLHRYAQQRGCCIVEPLECAYRHLAVCWCGACHSGSLKESWGGQ